VGGDAVAVAQKSEPRARAQVVTPRSSRRINKVRSQRKGGADIGEFLKSAAGFVKPAAFLGAIALLILGYNALASSRLFELNHITVSDVHPALQEEVEQVVRRTVGQAKLLEMDLKTVRQKVEAIPMVRSATVARVLPDGIFVQVVERHRIVLARRESGPQEGKLVWLDEDAVEMGEFSSLEKGEAPEIPPIVKGFAEGNRSQAAVNEDRERIALYQKIEREFKEGETPVWGLLDQIDLESTKDVNLSMARPHVQVHVGSTDFRKRFERALEILQAIKKGDSELLSRFRVQDIERLIENVNNINFIDATKSERIVVNFATPGAVKPSVQQEAKPKQAPKKK
jgi:hypothetical protein